MSRRNKRILKTVSVTDIDCNSCKKLKLISSIFSNPFTKNHTMTKLPSVTAGNYIPCHSSTTPKTASSASSSARAVETDSRWFTDGTTSSYSSPFSGSRSSKKSASSSSAVAVEKESNDPYLDFRQSMLQMVLENQIYSKNDLRELLNCFLRLNAPYHHGIIVEAFSDIWDGVFSGVGTTSASPLVRGYGGSNDVSYNRPYCNYP